MSLESPLGVRREATQAIGGSQPEERRGLEAEVRRINRRRKNPGKEGFRIHSSVPDIFYGEATRSAGSTKPSPRQFTIIDKLPKAGCLARVI
jgi:hypothetical protein